jgi:hypothetical protein
VSEDFSFGTVPGVPVDGPLPSALAIALQEAMDVLGMTQADFARAAELNPKTLGSIMTGLSKRPQKPARDRLDAFLVEPGPDGKVEAVTLKICQGKLHRYPGLEWRALAARLGPLGDDAHRHLGAFYDQIVSYVLGVLASGAEPTGPPAPGR